MRVVLALVAIALVGCPRAGGEYAQGDRMGGADRGETNGRTFDFASHRSEGDDWQIRIRDDSMWVEYSSGDEVAKDLGTKQLSEREARRIWDLIDTVEIFERKKGKPNEEDGYYELVLREPSDDEDEGHTRKAIYVSRDTDDEDVQALAEYLVKLIGKYHPSYKDDEDVL